jgi:hypothetical protein
VNVLDSMVDARRGSSVVFCSMKGEKSSRAEI